MVNGTDKNFAATNLVLVMMNECTKFRWNLPRIQCYNKHMFVKTLMSRPACGQKGGQKGKPLEVSQTGRH